MLTRILLPRGAAGVRLFATSVPRWNVKGTATAPLDADAIKAQIPQLKTAQQAIQKVELKARKERIAANIVAQKAKRVEKLAARRRKERLIAKRKVVRSQLLARKEKNEVADAARKAARATKMAAIRDRKQGQLAQRMEIRAQLLARAIARAIARKQQEAFESAEAKAERAAAMAARQVLNKQNWLAKRLEIRAQRSAQAVVRKEQRATESAEAKAERVVAIAARRSRKQIRLAKHKEIHARLRARRQEMRARAIASKERAAIESAESKTAAVLEKVKAKPWRKLGKLPARPLAVYMTEHFKAAQEPGEKIGVVIKRVIAQFKALTAEQRLPYEEKAAANLKVREAASAKIQGLKMSAYILFFKTNYQEVADSIPSAPIVEGAVVDRKALALVKTPLIAKAMGVKWKALSPEEQAAYKTKAAVIRAEAQKNLAEMT